MTPGEKDARPAAETRVGEDVQSESGPRGDVDRKDDARETATPPPLPDADAGD